MVKSKFTGFVLFVALLACLTVVLLLFLLNGQFVFFSYDTPIGFRIFFLFFFIYFLSLLIFGELRNKAVKINIIGDQIIKAGFCGLGVKKVFSFVELDGYITSIIYSKSGGYEYLYLIRNGKKAIKISEYYHSNYKELKQEIVKKGVKYLGVEYWSLLRETKEMFS